MVRNGNMELEGMENQDMERRMAKRGRLIKSVIGLALMLVVCACGESSQDHLSGARKSLAGSDYADAIASADAGLAGSPDAVTTWGLELVKLEALARSGQGEATRAQLEELAAENPDRVSAADYSGTAQLLRAAGQKSEAIQVLDMGNKRFPDDSVISKMIAESVEKGVDPAELEMLKSLGYID
jgi:predicted Zn-dependent protease